MKHPLLTTTNAYDLSAIMARAWRTARHTVKVRAEIGRPTTLKAAFRAALAEAWDLAKGARSVALWQAEQQRQREAGKLLDARTRAIADLQAARAAVDGIDGHAYFAAVAGIDARLTALDAR